MSALRESLQSDLFRRALVEAVLVGAVLGAVGVHVALRRMSFFVVAVSHGTFPGVVIASLIGTSLFVGGVGAAAVMIVAIVAVRRTREIDDSGAIGIVLSGAFALGVLLLSAQSGGSRDLSAFLVGQILTVATGDLIRTLVVGAVLVAAMTVFHKELVTSAFDPSGAAAVGYSPLLLDVGAMAIVAVALVVAIPAVGTILAVALLTVPALAARQLTERLPLLFVFATVFGALSGVVGMAASAIVDIAAGPAIALATVVAFVACVTAHGARRHVQIRKASVELTA